VSVTERTREIGLRLAIGALEREVLRAVPDPSGGALCSGRLIGIIIATAASWCWPRDGVPYLFNPMINLYRWYSRPPSAWCSAIFRPGVRPDGSDRSGFVTSEVRARSSCV